MELDTFSATKRYGSRCCGQAVVADEPAEKAREDRRQDRAPWPVPTQNFESKRNPGVSPAFRVLSRDRSELHAHVEDSKVIAAATETPRSERAHAVGAHVAEGHGLSKKLVGSQHHGSVGLGQSTVARYMCRHLRPPSQGWRTFLSNHADGIAAVDLFVLPTIAFRILYCLVIIQHGRRIWLSFGVTGNPTAEWISRQITEAFPWDHAPRYLIRDRDTSYGPVFVQRLRAMGIRDRPIAFRSPWQNAYVERLIGSIRRECLDHMIVFGQAHLRRILGAYAAYY
jgi:transposase InsO family protein